MLVGVRARASHRMRRVAAGARAAALLMALVPAAFAQTLATGISAGYFHTCAQTNGAAAKCWGDNRNGQLGLGTLEAHAIALAVANPGDSVNAVAAGGRNLPADHHHSCAITTGTGLVCWGDNAFGQLGDGTQTTRTVPTPVTGLASGVAAIALGGSHTCEVDSGSVLKCWGDNTYGQVGNGTTSATGVAVPTQAQNATKSVAGGQDHTCAVTNGGRVRCWGRNNRGQLGDGTTINHSSPTNSTNLANGNNTVGAGIAHSCVVTTGGGVKCWGANEAGQLGDGTFIDRSTATDVANLASGIAAIAAGGNRTCALTTTGAVKCWGSGTPFLTDVFPLGWGVTAISVGSAHVCAIANGGMVWCLYSNAQGQLGDGSLFDSEFPVSVNLDLFPPPAPFIDAVGGNHGIEVLGFMEPTDAYRFEVSCTSSAPFEVSSGSDWVGWPNDRFRVVVPATFNGSPYECRARLINDAGPGPWSNTSTALPGYALGAPFLTSVSPGNQQITVALDLPNQDGGPVLTYTARCASSNPSGTFETTAASPLTVSGLSVDVPYMCSVYANNALGPGDPYAFGMILATVPGTPAIEAVVPAAQRLDVHFSPPASDGGRPITGYTTSCSSSNPPVTISVNGSASPIAVGGLTNCVPYLCSVFATNALGNGNAAHASVPRVPNAAGLPPLQPGNSTLAFVGRALATGIESDPQAVNVTNVGAQALTIDSVEATTDFLISGCGPAPLTVAPGGSCTLQVRYAAASTNLRKGRVSIDVSGYANGIVIETFGNASMLRAGFSHNLALTRSGEVRAWGANTAAKLGNGTTMNSSVLVKVQGLDHVVD